MQLWTVYTSMFDPDWEEDSDEAYNSWSLFNIAKIKGVFSFCKDLNSD